MAVTSGFVLRIIPKNSRDWSGLENPTNLEDLKEMPSYEDSYRRCV